MFIFFVIIIVFIILLVSTVFVFWFVYLFERIFHYWKYYNSALRASKDYTEQVVYERKTELVKVIFLFAINLIEYTCLMAYVALRIFVNTQGPDSDLSAHFLTSHQYELLSFTQISFSVMYDLVIINLALISTLCRYLAAKYAEKSWINNKHVKKYLSLLAILIIIITILYSFCYLVFLAKCLQFLLEVSILAITIKQFKRLIMVIDWKIVGLGIDNDANNIFVLKSLIQNRRRSVICMTIIFIGAFLLIFSEFLTILLIGTELILQGLQAKVPNSKHLFCTID